MTSAVVVGVATGTAALQTILDVAKGQSVALDVATADRLKKESPAPKDFKPEAESQPTQTSGVALNSLEARAAVFCRLISLAIGSTKLRPAVVQSLVDMLNSNEQLHLDYGSSDVATLSQIADATAKLSAPGLSTDERSVLQSGQAVTLGVAAIATKTALNSMLAATAVASLTAEALQAQVCTTGKALPVLLFALLHPHNFMRFEIVAPAHNCCCRSKVCLKISTLARPPTMLLVR